MKITLCALMLCLLGTFAAKAQTGNSIRGAIADTALNIKLANAVVHVLQAKDSMIVKHQRAGADGSFAINNLPQGKFILLVTYPAYADYVETFSLDSVNKSREFPRLNMSAKARLLAEVVINGAAAITIKGDTTEFNAASFKTGANANVEELLKQLPGIQIDKDGKITAQGQKVKKVLVDGEEFFGDDPTLVTKNVRADMVDKVQLFDKKSDQAAFTGIDDGVSDKTINIKLKEGSKNGYFGKLDAGKSDEKYYQGQGMINAFKGKQKVAAYATVGNTGRTGLGWEDNGKYGASNVEVTNDGYISIGGGSDELESFDGRYNGEGIPNAKTGGAHYENKWNSDKHAINMNYKAGGLNVTAGRNTQTQNTLPSGVINNNQDQTTDNSIFRQKLDATYTWKIDTLSTLKFAVDGTLKNSETNSAFGATGLRGNNVLLNNQSRTLTNNADQKLMNMSVLWTHKFHKKSRTMSINATQSFNENNTDGYLNSINRFYNTSGTLDSTRTVDQYKTGDTNAALFNSNLTYTEPLSKYLSLVMNYGLGWSKTTADKKSFNKSASGNYDVLDMVYSNDFELHQLSNQGGATFNYTKKKATLNIGTKATSVNFDQKDLYTGREYNRNFLNWNPQASYQYKFSSQKSFRFNYYGNTTQPSVDQIQPVRVNTDPLNITLGNPDLKPSFSSRVSSTYNTYKVISGTQLYLNASYSVTTNPIVGNSTTDAAGKSTFQSVNLKEKNSSNLYMYMDLGTKIKFGEFDFNGYMNLNPSATTFYNYVNGQLNRTDNYRYSGGLSFNKYIAKKYDFYFGLQPSYNVTRSSLQRTLNNNGWAFDADFQVNITLPHGLQLYTYTTYQYKAKTQTFNEDFSRLLVTTRFSKKFFKKENLKFSIEGNDLFNQNVGFNRYASSNLITQSSYTTVKRYVMFSMTWDFTKMGGAAPQK